MTDAAAPPVDDIFATSTKTLASSHGFAWSPQAKPLEGRLKFLTYSVFLYIAIMVFSMLLMVISLYLFITVDSGNFEVTPMLQVMNDFIIIGGNYLPAISIGISLLCAVAYLMFVYRSMNNLHLSNARNLSTSPGWAVGWTFVPIVNLGMIFNVMKQIWEASHDPERGNVSAPMTLALWWGCWLGSNFGNRVSEVLIPRDPNAIVPGAFTSAYMPSVAVGMLCAIAGIASCILLITTIRQITKAQNLLSSTSAFE